MSDSREIAMADPQGGGLVRSESANIVAMILEAARDPEVDAAKVETMANLAIKLQDREREQQFNMALNAAIQEMPRIGKNNEIIIPANPNKGTPARKQGKFTCFEDLDFVVRPVLARHNLAIRFEIGNANGMITVRPIISHANGFTERGDAMALPRDESGSKNATQGVGSSTSYGKRYAMCAALNIVTVKEDDDGQGGTVIPPPSEQQDTLRNEAERQAAAGTYAAWYAKLQPRDRAWLVSEGIHKRLNRPAGEQAKEQTRPASEPATAARRTPEQMVADYEAKLEACKDPDDLANLVGDPATVKWVGNMRAHPELHARIIESEKATRRRIDDAEATRGVE